jgi:four helix bundle protein
MTCTDALSVDVCVRLWPSKRISPGQQTSMKLNRFEEIEAWQQARKLVNLVYAAINQNSIFQKDYRLLNQIQGAAVSVMSNIAEGFCRRSNKEFIQFLFVSKSSAAEVQSQLYVALDQNYITQDTFNKIYNQAELVSKLNSGFIKYLSKTQKTQQTQQTPAPKEPNKPLASEISARKKRSEFHRANKLKEPNELNKPNKLN